MLCPSCGRDNPSDARFCSECGANPNAPVAETPISPEETAILSSGFFVGRHREMGELKAALTDSLSGLGRLVMLAGEPGIGKTRTAQELASHAETLGVLDQTLRLAWTPEHHMTVWIAPHQLELLRSAPDRLRQV